MDHLCKSVTHTRTSAEPYLSPSNHHASVVNSIKDHVAAGRMYQVCPELRRGNRSGQVR